MFGCEQIMRSYDGVWISSRVRSLQGVNPGSRHQITPKHTTADADRGQIQICLFCFPIWPAGVHVGLWCVMHMASVSSGVWK